MGRSVTIGWPRPVFLLAAGVFTVFAAGAGVGNSPSQRETIELFAGIEKGQLDVKIFPRDSRESRLLLANKTGRPIRIALPEAFAAVPVLAQFQDPQLPANNQKELQPIAASPPMANRDQQMFFNNPLMPNQRALANRKDFPLLMPRGPAFFNVEPEKVIPVKLRTVCLQFGKAEPNPRVAYQVKPLEAVTRKPGVREVCRLLAGELDQKIIQAAAWHLNNGLSWEDLQRKHYKSDFGISEPILTSRQVKEGRRLAEAALEQAKLAKSPAASAN